MLVPEWPEDKLLYASTLRALRCFDAPVVSKEDVERTQHVRARSASAKRSRCRWARWTSGYEPGYRVKATPRRPQPFARHAAAEQDQPDEPATRRLTEAELQAGRRRPEPSCGRARLRPLGDAGLTGLVSLELGVERAQIVDFVLSCRVMGRKIEETMAAHRGRARGNARAQRVVADYLETEKNKPCLSSGSARVSPARAIASAGMRATAYPVPPSSRWRRRPAPPA